jgi:hypothetical protein
LFGNTPNTTFHSRREISVTIQSGISITSWTPRCGQGLTSYRFCYCNGNGDDRRVDLYHSRLVPAEGISESLLGIGKTDKRDIKVSKAGHLGRCGKVRRTAMPMFRSKDGHCLPARCA